MNYILATIWIVFFIMIHSGCGQRPSLPYPESIIEEAHQYSIIEIRHLLATDYEKILPHRRDNMSKRIGFDVEYESTLNITCDKDENTKIIKLDVYHPTIRLIGPAEPPLYSTEIFLENQNGKITSRTISEKPFPYQQMIQERKSGTPSLLFWYLLLK